MSQNQDKLLAEKQRVINSKAWGSSAADAIAADDTGQYHKRWGASAAEAIGPLAFSDIGGGLKEVPGKNALQGGDTEGQTKKK